MKEIAVNIKKEGGTKMKLSNYNMSVLKSNFKSLKDAGIKFNVVAEKSDIDMVWQVVLNGIEKLVFIHEGKVVAGISI